MVVLQPLTSSLLSDMHRNSKLTPGEHFRGGALHLMDVCWAVIKIKHFMQGKSVGYLNKAPC